MKRPLLALVALHLAAPIAARQAGTWDGDLGAPMLAGTWEVWKPPAGPMGEAGGHPFVRFSQHGPPADLIFQVTGQKEFPILASIPEHDFPGRTPRLRVDSNKPLIIGISGVSLRNGKLLLRQLLAGQKAIAEWYEWPNDTPRRVSFPLAGFAQAWRAASVAVCD